MTRDDLLSQLSYHGLYWRGTGDEGMAPEHLPRNEPFSEPPPRRFHEQPDALSVRLARIPGLSPRLIVPFGDSPIILIREDAWIASKWFEALDVASATLECLFYAKEGRTRSPCKAPHRALTDRFRRLLGDGSRACDAGDDHDSAFTYVELLPPRIWALKPDGEFVREGFAWLDHRGKARTGLSNDPQLGSLAPVPVEGVRRFGAASTACYMYLSEEFLFSFLTRDDLANFSNLGPLPPLPSGFIAG